jgi:hypothetical protein
MEYFGTRHSCNHMPRGAKGIQVGLMLASD